MRRWMTVLLIATGLGPWGREAAAQATGTPTFNAPYRAFTRAEFGALLSFPEPDGVAIEGAYRLASGRFDIGFKGGFWDPEGPGDAVVLVGAEGRQRVITHNVDFPLDGALVVGVGGQFVSNASVLVVPVGLSLGRRIDPQGSTISIVPYVQPTLFILGGDVADHVQFSLGLGADFRFTPRFDGRIAAGIGDLEGVSLGFVWVR
ncbi:MAG TPA: hypothetical protein VNI61_08585 [Gemmatimonadales bacterium]|nr:hypothetical protein [Gemmatimonadales bacterium]